MSELKDKYAEEFKNEEVSKEYKTSNKFKITLDNGIVDFQKSGRTLGDITETLNESNYIYLGNTSYQVMTVLRVEFLGSETNWQAMVDL